MSDVMRGFDTSGAAYQPDGIIGEDQEQNDPVRRIEQMKKEPGKYDFAGPIFSTLAEITEPAVAPIVNKVLDAIEELQNFKATGKGRTSAQGMSGAARQFGGRR